MIISQTANIQWGSQAKIYRIKVINMEIMNIFLKNH